MTITRKRLSSFALLLFCIVGIFTNTVFVMGESRTDQTVAIAHAVSLEDSNQQDSAGRAKERIREIQRKEFDGLLELGDPRHSDSPAAANTFLERHRAFLATWTHEPNKRFADDELNRQAAERVRGADIIYREAREAKEFEGKVDDFLRNMQGVADLEERLTMHNAFLDTHPAAKLAHPAIPHREQVVMARIKTIDLIDQQKWNRLLDAIRSWPERFSANRQLVRDFLRENPETKYESQARSLISQIESDWDKHDYNRLKDLLERYQVSTVPTNANVLELIKLIREYSNRQDPPPKMKTEVIDWLNWFDDVAQASTISVYVKKVEITRRSYLDRRWDGSVALLVRYSRRISTEEEIVRRARYELLEIEFNETLEGIPYNAGELIPLSVISRWGWTRGIPRVVDRNIKPRISVVTKEVPLMHDNRRTGTLYVNVESQPSLLDYMGEK